MNKMYIIHFRISHDCIVSTWFSWNESDAIEKMKANPEWEYTLSEDNDTHKIWDAR